MIHMVGQYLVQVIRPKESNEKKVMVLLSMCQCFKSSMQVIQFQRTSRWEQCVGLATVERSRLE